MNKQNHNQEMYQASDGKWYPKAQMPQNWQGQQQQSYGQPYGQQQQYYGQQQMGYGGQHQPQQVYVQQRPGGGAGAGAGAGLAACCGALLCFNLGACMF